MTTFQLPSLDWAAPIVDVRTGRVTPYFQRFWQNITLQAGEGAAAAPDVANKVDKGTSGGWSAPTGTSSKSGFATYTAPVAGAVYSQAEMQGVMDALQMVTRHVKALEEAGISSGLLS